MEHLPTPATLTGSAPLAAATTAAPDARANCCAVPAPRKLDLTGMAAPGDLQAVRLEEFSIDGICGVY